MEQEGLIIANFGTQVEVASMTNDRQRKRCHFRSNLEGLVTGDRVIWRDGNATGVVVAVLNRLSQLARPDPHGEMKTIAANVDRIFIVIAPLPKPHTQVVDRYLVAAESMGIQPILIINKMDLINSENEAFIKTLIELYRSLDYTVLTTSVEKKEGLNQLTDFLKQHTSIFVGQSGVGKSSLVNHLIPDLNLQIGKLSEANQKGRHTTTTTQLFYFPEEGYLIDSPGIREFGLWHMTDEEILYGFVEFRPYIGQCRFRDCQHQHDIHCAIRQAHCNGHISDLRFKSYLNLRQEIKKT